MKKRSFRAPDPESKPPSASNAGDPLAGSAPLVRVLVLLLALGGGLNAACSEEKGKNRGAAPTAPAGPPPAEARRADQPEEPIPFESLTDLLRAIQEGEFAERAGLEETFAVILAVPDPIEVAFVTGTTVPSDEIPKLEALAETLTAHRELGVELVGCSGPSGPAPLNLEISTQRAESVAALLRELGVAPEQITKVEGRGEACAVQERVVHVTTRIRNADGDAA